MKKSTITLTSLALFVIATTAMAKNVTLSVTDRGAGWASIGYTTDANVSGFGLKIDANNGAKFTEIKDYNVGECTASKKGYGIFPGTIDINETTGYVDYNGTPVAPNTAPGAASSGIGTGTLIIEMGALWVEPNHPNPTGGTLLWVKVDKNCTVTVVTEPIRGNIVFTDATSDNDANACANVTVECFYVGKVDGCGNTITTTQYNNWVAKGKPASWCYQCHCRCDTNNDCKISTTDLTALRNAWPGMGGTYNPTCDTNYDAKISTADLTALRNAWPGMGGNSCNGLIGGCP